MTTDDAEPVAGPSHGSSHVMQMTSRLPLCVQQLNYDDFDDVNDNNGSDGFVDVSADDTLTVTYDSTATSTDVFTSSLVLHPLLTLLWLPIVMGRP